jgi:hypothetical protein
MRTRWILSTLLGLGLAAGSLYFLLPQYLRAQEAKPAPNGAGIDSPWTQAQVLHSTDLNRMLADKAVQPKVFNVGFEVLYKSKHIAGSIYAGPGSKEAGIEALKLAVAHVPKDSQIILYCGCCPWDHCPNMKPAFKVLQGMGFKKIKVLEIPTNFTKDWIDLGFPVEGATANAARQ